MPFEASASRLRVGSRARRDIKYDALVEEASNFRLRHTSGRTDCASATLYYHALVEQQKTPCTLGGLVSPRNQLGRISGISGALDYPTLVEELAVG